MKKNSIFLILWAAAGLTACDVYSIHPLYTSSDLVRESHIGGLWNGGIGGLWKASDEDSSFALITIRSEEPSYSIKYYSNSDTLWYEAHYLKLKEKFFLDLFPMDKSPYGIDDLLLYNYIPAHSFMKIVLRHDSLLAYPFDGKKMSELFRQNRIRLRHEMLESSDGVLITASTGDLQKFINKYANNVEVFTDPMIFIKEK